MTNANRFNLDHFHPALTTACTESGCGALAGQPCVYETPTEGRWSEGRYTYLSAGMVAYRGPGEHNKLGRCPDGTGPAWGMVHVSRLGMARVARAERLMASEKAGQKALAESDDAVPSAKSVRCYVAIGYRSIGDEALAFIAGPMTPAAAARLHDDAGDPTNVVSFQAVTLDASQVASCTERGKVDGIGRLVTLPSQMGYVVRGEDDADVDHVVARPSRREVQADWLEQIAV